MIGRIGLQEQARRPPGVLGAKVAHLHARSGHEGFPIGQHVADLFVASRGPDAVRLQPDHGPGLAELMMEWVRVGEDIHRVRIQVDRRHTRSRYIVFVEIPACLLDHGCSFPYLQTKTIPP